MCITGGVRGVVLRRWRGRNHSMMAEVYVMNKSGDRWKWKTREEDGQTV